MNTATWRILLCYSLIALSVLICHYVSMWFYPIAILIIGNQYFTLALIGHDGSHGLLNRNRNINNFLARYLCFFPMLSSFSFYSMNHLHHHRNQGSPQDPDIFIYQNSYTSIRHWIGSSIKNTINLKNAFEFISYFNGGHFFITGKFPYKIKTDYGSLLVYWILMLSVFFYFKVLPLLFLFWFFPILLWLPWLKLINTYQHFSEDGPTPGKSYNIVFKNKWLQEFLFPVNINYHEVHHRHPNLPYHQLPQHFEKSKNTFGFLDFSKTIFSSQKSKIS